MAANTKRSARAGASRASQVDDTDAFHLVIMDLFDSEILPRRRTVQPDEEGEETHLRRAREKYARIFATYRGARVTKTIRRRKDKGEAPTSFGDIIKVHERIKSYTNRERGSLPSEAELVAFGATLFDTLFQGDVKRLYDEARARNSGRKLDLVLTSMIPWIAEKPWEFAYDQARRRFLATEDVHFVRNVLTAVPADTIAVSKGCLNILVVSAQPVGFGKLSIDQERKVIQRGFGSLIESGLANVKMLPRATPTALRRELASGDYSVVHFIGHGEFDEERGEGVLDLRGWGRRQGTSRRAPATSDFLQSWSQPGISELLPEWDRRPDRLQQRCGAGAGGKRPASARCEPIQRARRIGDVLRTGVLSYPCPGSHAR